MASLLIKSPIERLVSSAAITPQEIALAIVGLNPHTRMVDVPDDLLSSVNTIRRGVARAVAAYYGRNVTTTTPCKASDILLACFPFVDDKTPSVVTLKTSEVIDHIRNKKGWEEKTESLGGIGLFMHVEELKKKGRGNHRKKDEEIGTLKMMGLLIKLLSENNPKYRKEAGKINIAELHRDVLRLTEAEGTNDKGIGKSTFFDKSKRSILSIHDLDNLDDETL